MFMSNQETPPSSLADLGIFARSVHILPPPCLRERLLVSVMCYAFGETGRWPTAAVSFAPSSAPTDRGTAAGGAA